MMQRISVAYHLIYLLMKVWAVFVFQLVDVTLTPVPQQVVENFKVLRVGSMYSMADKSAMFDCRWAPASKKELDTSKWSASYGSRDWYCAIPGPYIRIRIVGQQPTNHIFVLESWLLSQ